MSKYINLYTDFGFKKLFGEEGNKDLQYEKSRMNYLGVKAVSDSAKIEGREEGREEGKEEGKEEKETEIILKLHKKGKSVVEISELLDVPEGIIQPIIQKSFEPNKE